MSIVLDHIFIITKPEAVEAERLIELGFIEGNANVHQGQGTSNRRFFLDDFTIEFLYVNDAIEAATGAGQGLGILARSYDSYASPFGIVVRVSNEEIVPTFPNWSYVPDYFDGIMCFYVGSNSDTLSEPLCICMPPSLSKQSSVPVQYRNPAWRLTGLDIQMPGEEHSEVLKCFAAIDRVRIERGKTHKMTLKFNNGDAKQTIDLAPALPLTLTW